VNGSGSGANAALVRRDTGDVFDYRSRRRVATARSVESGGPVARRQTEMSNDAARRRQVMEAAKAAITERGLSRVRMRDIAKLSGMSPGHVLSYFKSKVELLVRTLLWDEGEWALRRRAESAAIEDAPGRLRYFIETYVPSGPADPSWALWLAGYGLMLSDPDIFLTVEDVIHGLEDDLAAIVEFGIGLGEFNAVDARDFAERLCVLLNGYSISVVTGDPRYDEELAATRVVAAAASGLGVDPEWIRPG
jgi:AcrR family transcriptional regulator